MCGGRGREEGGGRREEGGGRREEGGGRREEGGKILEEEEEKVGGLYLLLCTARASISSKKIMAGAALLALPNTCRTALSESPTHLLNSSGP